eukprot:UN02563
MPCSSDERVHNTVFSSWNCPCCGFVNSFFNDECVACFVVKEDGEEFEFEKLRIGRVMISYLISYKLMFLNKNTIILMSISNEMATPKLANKDLFGKFGDIKLLRIERMKNKSNKSRKSNRVVRNNNSSTAVPVPSTAINTTTAAPQPAPQTAAAPAPAPAPAETAIIGESSGTETCEPKKSAPHSIHAKIEYYDC